jgi:hypothetical protein
MAGQKTKVKGVADLVFLIDATGSMEKFITKLKENVKEFIKMLVSPGPNVVAPLSDWRMRVVGYRDVKADTEWLVENPFLTKDVAGVEAQLMNLKAEGGGDEPEHLLDALYKVVSIGATEKGQAPDPMKWRYRYEAKRIVAVFTDATFHETMAIPEAAGGGIKDIQTLVTMNGVRTCIFAPRHACYEQLTLMDRCEYEPLEDAGKPVGIDEFTQDKNRFKAALESIAKTATSEPEPTPKV